MRGIRGAAMAGVMLSVGLLAASGLRAEDTITGEVVDLSCYLAHPDSGRGAGHKKCAETCAKKGLPMGILTEDKQVFVLLENHDNPKGYAAAIEEASKTVTAAGTKTSQGGVNGFVVDSIK